MTRIPWTMLTYAQALEVLNGRQSKVLIRNARTVLHRIDAQTLGVRLYETDVVLIHEDGTYTLNTGGWPTVVTQERLNSYSPACVTHRGCARNNNQELLVYAPSGGGFIPLVGSVRVDASGRIIESRNERMARRSRPAVTEPEVTPAARALAVPLCNVRIGPAYKAAIDRLLCGDWSEEHKELAHRQGWDLFDTGAGLAIQRLDDPAGVELEEGWPPDTIPRHDSDEDAIASIFSAAALGDQTALSALYLHGTPNQEAVQRRKRQRRRQREAATPSPGPRLRTIRLPELPK